MIKVKQSNEGQDQNKIKKITQNDYDLYNLKKGTIAIHTCKYVKKANKC